MVFQTNNSIRATVERQYPRLAVSARLPIGPRFSRGVRGSQSLVDVSEPEIPNVQPRKK